MSNQIITFGCRLNIFESDIIKKQASDSGLDNAIIFNSCAVTQEAERQLRQSIRKQHREHPDKKIIVTGCAVQINQKYYSDMKEVSVVMGNHDKLQKDAYNSLKIASNKKVIVSDIMSLKEGASHISTNFEGKARAFIEIQNGCDHRCTFCIIPYGRGNNRSNTIGEIVKGCNDLIEQGFKEIVFTGVDITGYGSDLPGNPTLGQMIKRVLNLCPGLERLRLSSLDVAEIDDDLLELIKGEKRLMPHFHISLQSGDDMILKRMKRRHTRQDVLDFCKKVRTYRKDAAFGADIIVGFPTETKEMFLNSKNLVEEAGISMLHVFPYSKRDGTPAAKIPDDKQVPVVERKRRVKELSNVGNLELQKYLKRFIGRELNLLIENSEIAKSEEFIVVRINNDKKPGSIINAKIIGIENNQLVAENV